MQNTKAGVEEQALANQAATGPIFISKSQEQIKIND